MSVLNTLLWWQWMLLGIVPIAIFLLYFLKLRRQPVKVPSTLLWSRAVEDLHVNTIWQRLRRSLLLFLQLLIVLFIIFALLRPGWQGADLSDDRYILLIDNSASMSATDQTPTRLQEAKQQALFIVDQLQAGDAAMVIAFSDQAQVVQTFTGSRSTLRRQIERIVPSSRPTDARDALQAASGLSRGVGARPPDSPAAEEALPATLLLLSDGVFPAVTDVPLSNLAARFVPIGRDEVENVGIVAFSTDRNPEPPERWQAFCRLFNSGSRDATVRLELFLNDVSVDVIELTVPAGREKGWHFELPDLEEARLRLVMLPDDSLSLDNQAYAVLNRPRRARVLLVTPGDPSLQAALQTEQVAELADVTLAAPDVLNDERHRTLAAAGAYDLVIFDRSQPLQMPQANTLFLGALPATTPWSWRPAAGPPTIIDVDRVHPLTQLLDMSYVKIAEGHVLIPPQGSTLLFESLGGPLFAVAPREGFEDAVLGFPLRTSQDGRIVPNTNWPRRPSFPVFLYNAVRYLGGSRFDAGNTSIRPGETYTVSSTRVNEQLTVVTPSGTRQPMPRDGSGNFICTDTDTLGIYEVQADDGHVIRRFAVNLLDSLESNLQPRRSLELGQDTVVGASGLEVRRRELWKWLLLGAILLLMLEWYIYHRRVYV
jgi:hypothetical protein